ncbi:hypothetical protein WOLCODRAFT_37760, partial [Wolfiporia cocos MD-104 SS10]
GNPPPPGGNPGGGNPGGGNPGGGNPGGPPGGGGNPPQAPPNPQPPAKDPYYRTPMIKINPPDVFDGERSDMQNFINQCNSWFTMYETSFQNDIQRVIFILSYISGKGKTGQWKQNYHRVHTDPTTRRFFPPSLAQFDADFQKAFGAVQEIQKARRQILKLEQDKKDIDDYITEFNNMAGKAQYDRYSPDGNALLITLFEKGLPDHTTRYIIGMRPMPDNID